MSSTRLIRRGTPADTEAVIRMGVQMLASPPFSANQTADLACVRRFVESTLASETHAVFVADGPTGLFGMIAVLRFAHPWSGEEVCQEMGWWIDPEAHAARWALGLIRMAEAWAREQGIAVFGGQAPTARVQALYEKLGFERVDVCFRKRLVT